MGRGPNGGIDLVMTHHQRGGGLVPDQITGATTFGTDPQQRGKAGGHSPSTGPLGPA